MKDKLIALVGKPNCGKTAIFNMLTGTRQKVANYPGVTVERKEGKFKTSKDSKFRLLDLPGIYSLDATSIDEQVTSDALRGKIENLSTPDVILCIADATNLKLSLKMVIETLKLGIPTILILNKIDRAKKLGYEYDSNILSEKLGVPVIEVSATKKLGKDKLLAEIESTASNKHIIENRPLTDKHEIQNIINAATKKEGKQDNITIAIDRFLLHPFSGTIFFLFVIFSIFQAVFNYASIPMDLIDSLMSSLIELSNSIIPESSLRILVSDGVIAGVGSVLIFLPQILILFFFILVLEDTGYMARVAFLLDRIMGRVGLHGKSFIPLISSFACAIPGIMATRTIENPRDRIVTILIAPLMTCSARLPVYTLIISAFIPNEQVFGPIYLQGLALFILYFAGIASAMVVAFILRKFFLTGERTALLLEMPDYCMPSAKNIFLGLLERAKIFIYRAGKVILPLMVIVWFLSSYPSAPKDAKEAGILYSFAGIIGSFLAPIFAPLGFNWQMVVALIPGMAAREVSIGVLGTVYALSSEASVESLGTILASEWSLPTALSFLTWYIFAPQCLPTIGITKRETNGWFWPMVMLTYLMLLAYIASFVVYRVSSAMMVN